MRKTEIFARVLINAGYKATLEQAELNVRVAFESEFSKADFYQWNTIVSNGQKMVDNIGVQTRVDVRLFILDLWDC